MAADALRKTRRPVFDIALQFGYDSQQTFSRVFRRQFDQTPTAYRQAMRNVPLSTKSPTPQGSERRNSPSMMAFR